MKRIFFLTDIVLLTLIAYLAVGGFYSSFENDPNAARTPRVIRKPIPSEAISSIRPFSYYKPTIDRNLFGTNSPEKKNEPPRINLANLEQTGLDLILVGTVLAANGPSYAVIQQKAPKIQGLFREGDPVSGAVLKLILREEVVLRVGNKDEILRMNKGETNKKALRVAAAPKRVESPRPSGGVRIVLNRNEIQAAVGNVGELMNQAQIGPHYKKGENFASGLSVSSIKNDSIFKRMGLRDDDVITGIDGREIQSLDDALELHRSLKSSENVTLQVIRRGKEINLDYVIE